MIKEKTTDEKVEILKQAVETLLKAVNKGREIMVNQQGAIKELLSIVKANQAATRCHGDDLALHEKQIKAFANLMGMDLGKVSD